MTQGNQSLSVLRPASAKWIAGRVQTLLSHYYQPGTPQDVIDAALGDWVKQLSGFSSEQVEDACQNYLKSQPSKRPTPADVRNRIGAVQGGGMGDKSKLSRDEVDLLHGKILPTARRWLSIPDLADQGRKTLEYWGEQA